MGLCPCGSNSSFTDCCEPFINKVRQPETAEQCMRARYTAYARGKVDYLVFSHDPATRSPGLRDAIREWARRAEFRQLRIVNATGGTASDQSGRVQFEADYAEANEQKTLTEVSSFRRHEGRWVYSKGTAPKAATELQPRRANGADERLLWSEAYSHRPGH